MDIESEDKQIITSAVQAAWKAVQKYNGSEKSEQQFYTPLITLDKHFNTLSEDAGIDHDEEIEKSLIAQAMPNRAQNMPDTINGFLGLASKFYQTMKQAASSADLQQMLKDGGASVKISPQCFVGTTEGGLKDPKYGKNHQKYEIETRPRLAMLIEKLQTDGVNGQKIYLDDLAVTFGGVDKNMMRKHPYNIIQIPRLDMEIAVCDQVGEITFVKSGTTAPAFWDKLNIDKDFLKERPDITPAIHSSDEVWWSTIQSALAADGIPSAEKVNVKKWAGGKPNLNIDRLKEAMLEYYHEHGGFVHPNKDKETGEYPFIIYRDGNYTEKITGNNLDVICRNKSRGIKGYDGLADLKEEIAGENDLDYRNPYNQPDLKIGCLKEAMLEYHREHGDFVSSGKNSETGKHPTITYRDGDYTEEITGANLKDICLRRRRGVTGYGGGLGDLKEEIAQEHGLPYTRRGAKPSKPTDDLPPVETLDL